MKTIKRAICILSSLCITLSMLNFVSASAQREFNDLPSSHSCYPSVMRLSELGIINGYEDNTFRPGNSVTRAEFCKIVVAMLDKETQAKSTPPTSNFDDVNKVAWCIPYVNYLTGNDIIKGYADATFKPTKVITYAEAVTIICRILGYNEEDIGYSWPTNYITQAGVLGLTNEKLSASSSVTRAIMAGIVNNALFTCINGQSDKTFLETIDYDAIQNTVVPVKASKNYSTADAYLEGTPIKYENLTVYKDNKTVSVSDIKIDDVVYYNTRTNVMDVYNKKITGIYTDALPSKAYVTSVNVGGNVYKINPKVSSSSLDASVGSFDIGDRVTLLLGKDDEICFAVESSGFDKFEYGVLLKTYSEISDSGDNVGSSQIMASVFMPDGNTYEYQTQKNYKDYIGQLVKLDYSNGFVSMSKPTSSQVYGNIDFNKRTLGSKNVLKDVTVIHRLSDEYSSVAEVELLNFDTLDVNAITSNQLITSISTNAFGDVAILYLCDMPSGYQYGYLRGSEDHSSNTSISVTYKIFSGSDIVQYQSSTKYSFSGGAVLYKVSGGKLVDMKQMITIAQSSSIGAIEGGRIMINNTIYKMADNVLIVDTSDTLNYKTLSLNDLTSKKISSVAIYSDKSASADGIIRVIKVTTTK